MAELLGQDLSQLPLDEFRGRFAGGGRAGRRRGMTETLTIGDRVAFYRGQSHEVLAGLVERTEDWLSRVENNKIELDRHVSRDDRFNWCRCPVPLVVQATHARARRGAALSGPECRVRSTPRDIRR